MFSFSKKKKTEEGVIAVFDIGSASVGGALVLLSKDKKPKILYSTRKQMTFQDSLNVKKFKTSMFRALKSTVFDLEKKGLVHLNFLKIESKEIKESFCFLSSPWSVSRTKVVEINRNKPFVVSEEMMNSLIRKEEDVFVNSDLDVLDENNGVELMDRKIVQFRLNEYKVENPYRKKVNSAEATLFLSVASKDILDKIEDTIGRVFHLGKLHMHSFTLASFLSLRDIFEFEEDFVFLDVSGEVTDISFVKGGVLKEVQTFPLGRNSFIREVIKSFGSTYELATSVLRSSGFDELDEKTELKLNEALSGVRKEWGKYIENGMLELSNGSILPKNIFILADDDISGVLKNIIETERFVKLVFPDYDKVANPILINSHKIDKFCNFGGNKERDVFLGIEAMFINRLFGTN